MSNEHPFPQNEDLIGKQIGQFMLIEEVGRGGMATVYRAMQQSINRDVALKVLPRSFLHDPGFYERFVREVDVIAHLEHPHIVPIYDFGEYNGIPYIAMRYLAGGSLRKLIKAPMSKLSDLVRPVSQIAQALDHSHQNGIIHRDLKPANILLDQNNNAYLSDFGIARILNSDLTGSSIIGTPAYMSPEQAEGKPLDARADIYSLGIVTFELITGREPFDAETPIAMILKHMNERVPYLSEFRDGIPPEVDAVIAKATEKKREDRYSSAGDFADAFAEAVRGTAGTLHLPTQVAPQEGLATETLSPAYVANPTPVIDKAGLYSETLTPAYGISSTKTPTDSQSSKSFTNDKSDMPTTFTNQPEKPKRRGRSSWFLYSGGAALILFVTFLSNIYMNWQTDPLNLAPEAFEGGEVIGIPIDDFTYTISIPQDWIAENQFIDQSNTDRPLYHLWNTRNEAFVSLTLLEMDQLRSLSAIQTDFTERYYAERDDLTAIGSPETINTTIRQSYRVGSTDTQVAGQMDVFFARYNNYLVAFEMYSADSVENDYVETFQNILESFRLYTKG